MTLCTCPNCGFDFERLASRRIGDLDIIGNGTQVMWKGRLVRLTVGQRLVLLAIVRSGGHPISCSALIGVLDSDSDNPVNMVAVYISRLRQKFRNLDPDFDQIVTVRDQGYRWKALGPVPVSGD